MIALKKATLPHGGPIYKNIESTDVLSITRERVAEQLGTTPQAHQQSLRTSVR